LFAVIADLMQEQEHFFSEILAGIAQHSDFQPVFREKPVFRERSSGVPQEIW